ncbi:hypothetical protein [Actinomadura rugatobispora]|uniref:Major tail protein n=1 Tax=Actinomadura rugatobispora TaxID=1994 RepID=A0ABW0ZRZ8_9ACTN|nr:hypothetical protein GCM10010200_036480 [Actinomadura rugatobispora]
MAGADLLGDGNVAVIFALSVASISAPTASECNGGTALQEFITKEGLQIEAEQEAVDNTALASRSETEDAGTTKYQIELTVKRKEVPAEDVGYNTLVAGQLGYLIVRRDKAHETTFAADDRVEVYPVRCGTQRDQPPELNTPQTFMIKLFNHTAPDTRAVVAA